MMLGRKQDTSALEERVDALMERIDRLVGVVEKQSQSHELELSQRSMEIDLHDREQELNRQAVELFRQEEEFRRAASPEGGDVVPAMEGGEQHWSVPIERLDPKSRARAELAEQIRQKEGWVQPEGVLTVVPPRTRADNWQVRDARTGNLVDEFYGPDAEANARAYVVIYSEDPTNPLVQF